MRTYALLARILYLQISSSVLTSVAESVLTKYLVVNKSVFHRHFVINILCIWLNSYTLLTINVIYIVLDF